MHVRTCRSIQGRIHQCSGITPDQLHKTRHVFRENIVRLLRYPRQLASVDYQLLPAHQPY